ncbi:MAG: polymerase subunit delta, partial [Gaiellales bacterium]|nr:polymerase subunit delta [Gaiellales bacterium]
RRGRALAHKPAYLIAGSDWPKIDAAAVRLRGQFDEDSVEQIAVRDEAAPDVVSTCNALGLFGGERLVLVRGVEALDADQLAAIIAYLADPAPGTCLALFGGGGLPQDGPLATAVAAVGDVRIFDAPDDDHAAQWVVKRFSEQGISCPLAIAKRIVRRAGIEIGDLALEVEKLAVHGRGEPPTEQDVDLLVAESHDVKPWNMTDAWGRRDAAGVIAFATADIEKPDDVLRISAIFANHVRRVRQAMLVMEGGGSAKEVQKQLGLRSPYQAQGLCRQARAFSEPELAGAVVRLAQLDLAIKGGSRLDPRLELELALVEISSE